MTGPEAAPPTPPGDGSSPPGRRPARRRDPAAMRETLDDARRRLGPAVPADGPAQSAARQRALLREAVASQAVPLVDGPGATPAVPATPSDPPAPRAVDRDDPGARD